MRQKYLPLGDRTVPSESGEHKLSFVHKGVDDINRHSQEMERVIGVTEPLHSLTLRVYFYSCNHTDLMFLVNGPLDDKPDLVYLAMKN